LRWRWCPCHGVNVASGINAGRAAAERGTLGRWTAASSKAKLLAFRMCSTIATRCSWSCIRWSCIRWSCWSCRGLSHRSYGGGRNLLGTATAGIGVRLPSARQDCACSADLRTKTRAATWSTVAGCDGAAGVGVNAVAPKRSCDNLLLSSLFHQLGMLQELHAQLCCLCCFKRLNLSLSAGMTREACVRTRGYGSAESHEDKCSAGHVHNLTLVEITKEGVSTE